MIDLRTLTLALVAASVSVPASASPELARSKNCVACHSVERRMVGPAYKAMAERYPADDDNVRTLSEKIRKGGGGVWGPMPMPPQANVSPEEAEALARWILSHR